MEHSKYVKEPNWGTNLNLLEKRILPQKPEMTIVSTPWHEKSFLERAKLAKMDIDESLFQNSKSGQNGEILRENINEEEYRQRVLGEFPGYASR